MNLSNEKEKQMKRILEIILFPDFEYEFVRECTPAEKKIHPQDPWTRSTKREGVKRVLTRDTSTIETSQTRSNGTKVAETKEKEEES